MRSLKIFGLTAMVVAVMIVAAGVSLAEVCQTYGGGDTTCIELIDYPVTTFRGDTVFMSAFVTSGHDIQQVKFGLMDGCSGSWAGPQVRVYEPTYGNRKAGLWEATFTANASVPDGTMLGVRAQAYRPTYAGWTVECIDSVLLYDTSKAYHVPGSFSAEGATYVRGDTVTFAVDLYDSESGVEKAGVYSLWDPILGATKWLDEPYRQRGTSLTPVNPPDGDTYAGLFTLPEDPNDAFYRIPGSGGQTWDERDLTVEIETVNGVGRWGVRRVGTIHVSRVAPTLAEQLVTCDGELDSCEGDLETAEACRDDLTTSAEGLGLTVDGCDVQGTQVWVAPGQIKAQPNLKKNKNAVMVIQP